MNLIVLRCHLLAKFHPSLSSEWNYFEDEIEEELVVTIKMGVSEITIRNDLPWT